MSADPIHEYLVPPAAAGQRLDLFLAEQGLPYSRSQLTRRIDEGEVQVDGGRAKPGQKLRPAQRIRFRPPPPRAVADQAEAIPLVILYEDRHLIVLDKPAGLVVHPAPGHQTGTLVNALLHHCGALPLPASRPARGDDDSDDDDSDDGPPTVAETAAGLSIGGERRPGIVHRLDQGTSGVLVCAKDEQTLCGLQAQFQLHSINRRYLALVEGVVAQSGSFQTRYGRHPRDRKRFTARSGGKHAVTHYTVRERLTGASLVEVQLETGRTHQIRVHFSEAGHPLLGDGLYGRPARLPLLREVGQALRRQALHARLLGFRHPMSGEWLEFSSEPPLDFQQALDRLRSASAPSSKAPPAPGGLEADRGR